MYYALGFYWLVTGYAFALYVNYDDLWELGAFLIVGGFMVPTRLVYKAIK